ncbi:MAG TPA: hypothetical protein DCX65_10855 [Spirochaetaceae bacterium]|nr:hypothetical protein [Spirochaetaceae bacterium]
MNAVAAEAATKNAAKNAATIADAPAAAAVAATDDSVLVSRPAGRLPARTRPADLFIIACGLALTALAAWLVYAGPPPARLLVQVEGREFVYPLAEDRLVSVAGPLGLTVIELSHGAARILESPCTNKTCISAGWQEATGEWSACLPNEVFLRIDGEAAADGGVDAILH